MSHDCHLPPAPDTGRNQEVKWLPVGKQHDRAVYDVMLLKAWKSKSHQRMVST